jgi:hypothetical protein
MKGFIASKTLVGIVSSTAITGGLLLGLGDATATLPQHWFIDGTPAAPPIEVRLLSEQPGGLECEWIGPDPLVRVARCPTVVVTAKRPTPGSPVIASAGQQDDSGKARQQLAHARAVAPSTR